MCENVNRNIYLAHRQGNHTQKPFFSELGRELFSEGN